MSNARDLIRTNTGPQSGLIFNADYANSYFTPKGWTKSTNYSMQKIEITPTNPTQDAGGATVEFRPAKNADYYGYPVAQMPTSAITPGTGASYTRFVDFLGHHLINNLTISHVSNVLTRLDGNVLHPIYRKNSERRRRYQWDPLLAGNLGVAARELLAQAPQVIQVPLDNILWFTYATCNFVPVIALSHELRFELTLNQMQQVIQSDHTSGVPTASISTQTIKGVSYPLAMIFSACHVTGDERTWQNNLFEADGIMAPFKEYKQQPRYTVIAGTSGVISVRLTALKDQISEIYWVIRSAEDLSTNYGNEPNRRLTYVSASLTGNGGQLIADHTKEYIDRRVREQFHSAEVSEIDNIGVFPLCWVPEDPVNNTGSIHMGIISDPTLNINIGTAVGQSTAYDVLNGGTGDANKNIVIDVFIDAFNWLHYVGGDINKTFN